MTLQLMRPSEVLNQHQLASRLVCVGYFANFTQRAPRQSFQMVRCQNKIAGVTLHKGFFTESACAHVCMCACVHVCMYVCVCEPWSNTWKVAEVENIPCVCVCVCVSACTCATPHTHTRTHKRRVVSGEMKCNSYFRGYLVWTLSVIVRVRTYKTENTFR